MTNTIPAYRYITVVLKLFKLKDPLALQIGLRDTYTHTHTHTHTHSITPHTHSHPHILTHTHSHTYTLTHTHTYINTEIGPRTQITSSDPGAQKSPTRMHTTTPMSVP